MICLGWLKWGDVSPDLCLVVALFVIGGCAACETLMTVPAVVPPCPTPTLAMIEEAASGAIDDAPAISEFLGKIENYCFGIEALNE